jgi:hypothetical protein
VSSTTGLVFSYAIGLIFTVGGLIFLFALDDNRLLFGIPYLVMGVLMLGGIWASQRRRRRRRGEPAGPRTGA